MDDSLSDSDDLYFEDDPSNPPFPPAGDFGSIFGQDISALAEQIAVSYATRNRSEPNIDPSERIHIEGIADAAKAYLQNEPYLKSGGFGSCKLSPVNRSKWARETVGDYSEFLKPQNPPDISELMEGLSSDGEGSSEESDFAANLMGSFAPIWSALVSGLMAGRLTGVAFGSFELILPRKQNEIFVLPANVNSFARHWDLPIDNLWLWLSVSEMARAEIVSTPHIASRIAALVGEYGQALGDFSQEAMNLLPQGDNPHEMSFNLLDQLGGFEITESEEVSGILLQLETLTAVVSGYADYITEKVVSRVIDPSLVREAVVRHWSQESDTRKFIKNICGIDSSGAPIQKGRTFLDGVVSKSGEDKLKRLTESEATLPTPVELETPGLWLARVEMLEV